MSLPANGRSYSFVPPPSLWFSYFSLPHFRLPYHKLILFALIFVIFQGFFFRLPLLFLSHFSLLSRIDQGRSLFKSPKEGLPLLSTVQNDIPDTRPNLFRISLIICYDFFFNFNFISPTFFQVLSISRISISTNSPPSPYFTPVTSLLSPLRPSHPHF